MATVTICDVIVIHRSNHARIRASSRAPQASKPRPRPEPAPPPPLFFWGGEIPRSAQGHPTRSSLGDVLHLGTAHKPRGEAAPHHFKLGSYSATRNG